MELDVYIPGIGTEKREIINRKTDICLINGKMYNISVEDNATLEHLRIKLSPFLKEPW